MNDITCFMLYFGRKELAEESVESFLRQTYPHKKLIIVNDHPDPIVFDKEYDNIEVHNVKPDTFTNLNEKYNYALSQVKTKWFCSWDDDDIWLSWHLENLASNIDKVTPNEYPMKIGMPLTLYSQDNEIIKVGWQMWGDCIFEMKEGLQCDSKSHINCDRQIVWHNDWNRYWLRIADYSPSFIFRRFSGKQNASMVLGEKGVGYGKKLKNEASKVSIKEPFLPQWKRDYDTDAKVFMDKVKKSMYNSKYVLQKVT